MHSENSEIIICLDSFSVFETTAMLKFSNIQYFPLAPFARFIGSLMRL